MSEKQFKQVCECKHCGNESEMTITCSLTEHQAGHKPVVKKDGQGNVQGHAVCSHCGSEADIWLEV